MPPHRPARLSCQNQRPETSAFHRSIMDKPQPSVSRCDGREQPDLSAESSLSARRVFSAMDCSTLFDMLAHGQFCHHSLPNARHKHLRAREKGCRVRNNLNSSSGLELELVVVVAGETDAGKFAGAGFSAAGSPSRCRNSKFSSRSRSHSARAAAKSEFGAAFALMFAIPGVIAGFKVVFFCQSRQPLFLSQLQSYSERHLKQH